MHLAAWSLIQSFLQLVSGTRFFPWKGVPFRPGKGCYIPRQDWGTTVALQVKMNSQHRCKTKNEKVFRVIVLDEDYILTVKIY